MGTTEASKPPAPVRGGTLFPGAGIGDRVRLWSAGLAMAAIFLVDTFTPLQGAIAVLYLVVLLLASNRLGRRGTAAAATVCAGLTLLAHLLAYGLDGAGSAVLRCLVSLAAIAATAWLLMRNQAFTATLARQARILDLTHDAIFVQGVDGIISYWNKAAEEMYGWSAAEALGKTSSDLLQTEFPEGRAGAVASLLETGSWDGEIVQITHDRRRLVVACRWALLRDTHGGATAIIETNTDISERRRAEAALVRSEWRHREIFARNGVAILEQDWSAVRAELQALRTAGIADLPGHLAEHPEFVRRTRAMVHITGLNAVAQRLLCGGKGKVRTLDEILPDDDLTFAQSLLAIDRGDATYQSETGIRALDGRALDILFVVAFPPRAEEFSSVLVSLLDITERKATEQALLTAQKELAHAGRIATIGTLTASLAHEINQPLAAIVTNASAALRWLRRPQPELGEAEVALERVVRDGGRAAAIISQARGFLAKGNQQHGPIDLAETICEALLLVEQELRDLRVALRLHLPRGAPRVLADRVQVQQVIVNLAMNAAQAMSLVPEPRRELIIQARQDAGGHMLVEVQDRGAGVAPELLPHLFEPFRSTRPGGMGLGLAICRSTVEASGGRLWATSDPGRGATFRFTLPAEAREEAA